MTSHRIRKKNPSSARITRVMESRNPFSSEPSSASEIRSENSPT